MLGREQQQEQQKRRNNTINNNSSNNNKSTIVTGSASLINTVFKHMDSNNNEDHHQYHNNVEDTKMEKKIMNNKKNEDIIGNVDSNKLSSTDDPNDYNKNIKEEDTDDDASILSKQTQRCLVIRRITYIVIVNAVTPILLYYLLKPYLPPVWALVLSSTPTIISVLIQATFLRHMDTIGIASICGFLVSIVLAVANGDPKLMMMRESLITAGVGATCTLSLLPIRIGSFELKPIMYYLAKDLVPLKPVYTITNITLPYEGGRYDYNKEDKQENQEEDDKKQKDNSPIEDKKKEEEREVGEEGILQPRILFYWRNSRYCRMHIRLLTAIDIILLELEFGLKLYYIFSFDIDTVVIASSITWGIIGTLISVFTICYSVGILRRLKQNESKMLIAAGAITASTTVTATSL